MNVLISLHKGYGIGDAVQVSVILQHLTKYHPDWSISYQAEEGKYQVGRGIVPHHFAYGSRYPVDHYDEEKLICLYDKWYNFQDRPNTHVVACLLHSFGINWDRECGGYKISLPDEAVRSARYSIDKVWGCNGVRPVAVHHKGDTAKVWKDLTEHQTSDICGVIANLGRTPLLMDWRNESPLSHEPGIRTTGRQHFSKFWGSSVEMNTAVISQCAAFIGIDSGPAKCAGATNTPSLVIWTRHHPAQFYDLAPNVTHLVPYNYHSFYPVYDHQDVADWFEKNHQVMYYREDKGMTREVKVWLEEVLK